MSCGLEEGASEIAQKEVKRMAGVVGQGLAGWGQEGLGGERWGPYAASLPLVPHSC